MATREKTPALYCGNFPPELKERCESIAGALRKSITEFVAEILDDETQDLKSSCEAISRWYEARLHAKVNHSHTVNSSPEREKEEIRRDPEQADKTGTAKVIRNQTRQKAQSKEGSEKSIT